MGNLAQWRDQLRPIRNPLGRFLFQQHHMRRGSQQTSLQRSLLGATAHVMLLEKEPSEGISNWPELVPPLRKIPHVVNAAPVLYGTVLLSGPLGGGQAAGAEMKGIPVDAPPDMLLHLKQGSFEDLKKTTGLPGIILGASLARNTGMLLHSVVNIIPPQAELTPFGPKLARFQFRVVGIFESGFYEVDAFWAFTGLKSA